MQGYSLPDESHGDARDSSLRIAWSRIYRPEWDATPEAYVATGLVGWGRTRRLAKAHDPSCALTAYLGVQHVDPTRWNLPGAPTTKFFASLIVAGRTVALHTYLTMGDALAAVRAFHARLTRGPGVGH